LHFLKLSLIFWSPLPPPFPCIPRTDVFFTICMPASEQWVRKLPWAERGRRRRTPSIGRSSARLGPDGEGEQSWANLSGLSSAKESESVSVTISVKN
jgi:hypothetical protein